MFDEEEYAALGKLITHGLTRESGTPREERFEPMRHLHKQLTGREETNPNAIGHHRIALYGPPCTRCGRPLRTPRARFCAACGQVTDPRQSEARSSGAMAPLF